MQNRSNPIKRSEELVPLSRDHHNGLLLCWKIRYGLDNQIEINRIADYVFFFFNEDLLPHFRQEENFVFSLLRDEDPLKIEALTQHNGLYRLFNRIQADDADKRALLKMLSDDLASHIRFEERLLFPHIEQHADVLLLKETGTRLVDLHQEPASRAWKDEYWTKGK